jgi:hypothetical protein
MFVFQPFRCFVYSPTHRGLAISLSCLSVCRKRQAVRQAVWGQQRSRVMLQSRRQRNTSLPSPKAPKLPSNICNPPAPPGIAWRTSTIGSSQAATSLFDPFPPLPFSVAVHFAVCRCLHLMFLTRRCITATITWLLHCTLLHWNPPSSNCHCSRRPTQMPPQPICQCCWWT